MRHQTIKNQTAEKNVDFSALRHAPGKIEFFCFAPYDQRDQMREGRKNQISTFSTERVCLQSQFPKTAPSAQDIGNEIAWSVHVGGEPVNRIN